jgi:integrase
MSGMAREAKLDNRTRRAKLKRGRSPHWHTLVRSGTVTAHLGYQRWPEDGEGRWLLRRYQPAPFSHWPDQKSKGKYSITPIGAADDAQDADGNTILDFAQASTKARAMLLDAPRQQPSCLTVRDAIVYYTGHLRAQGKATAKEVECRATAHIIPTLGHIAIAELKPDQIRRWLSALAGSRAMVRTPKYADQRYKPEAADEEAVRRRRASANRILTMLKAALNHAFDEGWVDSNLAWGRRVRPFKQANAARVRYLTVAEAQRLINGCSVDFRPLVQAALMTGCRYSELCRLQVSDFNPDSGTVHIRRSKTGKDRHVELTDEGVHFFKETTIGRRGDAFMFVRDDKPWATSAQARPMAEACEQASISPPISFHGLRHTWASLAIMSGMPLMVVAKNLGHVDTRMVEHHYGHLSGSFVRDAVREHAPRFDLKKSNVTPIR